MSLGTRLSHVYLGTLSDSAGAAQWAWVVGNFGGRKLLQILQFCGYSQKFSLQNLGAWHSLAQQKQAFHKSFLYENRIFHQFAKVFSLRSVLLYSTPTKTAVCSYAQPGIKFNMWTNRPCWGHHGLRGHDSSSREPWYLPFSWVWYSLGTHTGLPPSLLKLKNKQTTWIETQRLYKHC